MGNESRTLDNITLGEAITVLQLGRGHHPGMKYQLKKGRNPIGTNFARLFYFSDSKEKTAAIFFDDSTGVELHEGISYFTTFYRIIQYLQKQDFNLRSADSR